MNTRILLDINNLATASFQEQVDQIVVAFDIPTEMCLAQSLLVFQRQPINHASSSPLKAQTYYQQILKRHLCDVIEPKRNFGHDRI